MIEMRAPAVYGGDELLPHEDTAVSPTAKSVDATKLTMPVVIVLAIVASSITSTAAISTTFWVMQSGQRQSLSEVQSDIRNIKTVMDGWKDLRAADQVNLDLRLKNERLENEKSELRKALLADLKTQ